MECTLATLVACFSWSNLYIDIGIQFQDRGDALLHEYELAVVDEAGREITDLRKELFFYRDPARNPYVGVALGYEVNFRSMSIRLQGTHSSSIATGRDKGVNSITLGARWYPFR